MEGCQLVYPFLYPDREFTCHLHAIAAFVLACFSTSACSACPHPAGRALGLGAADCAQACLLGMGAPEPTKPLAAMVTLPEFSSAPCTAACILGTSWWLS